MYVAQYDWLFDELTQSIEADLKGKPEQYTDPESKPVKLILWLFTIEPSFFADLNEACIQSRNCDAQQT